jgi:hypothetical protein
MPGYFAIGPLASAEVGVRELGCLAFAKVGGGFAPSEVVSEITQEVYEMADVDRPISWDDEDTYWRTNYRSRPYASSNDYDYYRPGYRYGYESASRYQNRSWDEIEPELSRGWSTYEHRGTSTWEQVKSAVRDAWDRVTGNRPVGTR